MSVPTTVSRDVTRVAADGGLMLAGFSVAFAVVGLSPGFSWVPEALLLGAAVFVPAVVLAWTGWRAARRANGIATAAFVTATAGLIGGGVAGTMYVLYGKSPLNVPIGLAAGAIAGSFVGGLTAALALRLGR